MHLSRIRSTPVWLSVVLLCLSACGLEPQYALPPPERNDGTFRWIDAKDAPPADYLPVTVDGLGTGRGLAVCRGFIVDQPIDQGYHTGEIRALADGTIACLVPQRGGVIRFLQRENAYQQLWAHEGATYEWLALESAPELPLLRSRLWQNNRLPGDYVVRITTGEPVAYWVPCAIKEADTWHIGKISIRDGQAARCNIPLDERAVAFYANVVVLYAPVK